MLFNETGKHLVMFAIANIVAIFFIIIPLAIYAGFDGKTVCLLIVCSLIGSSFRLFRDIALAKRIKNESNK